MEILGLFIQSQKTLDLILKKTPFSINIINSES